MLAGAMQGADDGGDGIDGLLGAQEPGGDEARDSRRAPAAHEALVQKALVQKRSTIVQGQGAGAGEGAGASAMQVDAAEFAPPEDDKGESSEAEEGGASGSTTAALEVEDFGKNWSQDRYGKECRALEKLAKEDDFGPWEEIDATERMLFQMHCHTDQVFLRSGFYCSRAGYWISRPYKGLQKYFGHPALWSCLARLVRFSKRPDGFTIFDRDPIAGAATALKWTLRHMHNVISYYAGEKIYGDDGKALTCIDQRTAQRNGFSMRLMGMQQQVHRVSWHGLAKDLTTLKKQVEVFCLVYHNTFEEHVIDRIALLDPPQIITPTAAQMDARQLGGLQEAALDRRQNRLLAMEAGKRAEQARILSSPEYVQLQREKEARLQKEKAVRNAEIAEGRTLGFKWPDPQLYPRGSACAHSEWVAFTYWRKENLSTSVATGSRKPTAARTPPATHEPTSGQLMRSFQQKAIKLSNDYAASNSYVKRMGASIAASAVKNVQRKLELDRHRGLVAEASVEWQTAHPGLDVGKLSEGDYNDWWSTCERPFINQISREKRTELDKRDNGVLKVMQEDQRRDAGARRAHGWMNPPAGEEEFGRACGELLGVGALTAQEFRDCLERLERDRDDWKHVRDRSKRDPTAMKWICNKHGLPIAKWSPQEYGLYDMCCIRNLLKKYASDYADWQLQEKYFQHFKHCRFMVMGRHMEVPGQPGVMRKGESPEEQSQIQRAWDLRKARNAKELNLAIEKLAASEAAAAKRKEAKEAAERKARADKAKVQADKDDDKENKEAERDVRCVTRWLNSLIGEVETLCKKRDRLEQMGVKNEERFEAQAAKRHTAARGETTVTGIANPETGEVHVRIEIAPKLSKQEKRMRDANADGMTALKKQREDEARGESMGFGGIDLDDF